MPKARKRSVYQWTYTLLSIIAVSFFAHNIFQSTRIDIFHLNKEFHFSLLGKEYVYLVKDLFPFMDAPETDIFGEVLRMEFQTYVHIFCTKLRSVCWALIAFKQQQAFNTISFIITKEVPDRGDKILQSILAVFCGLFAYDLLDFVMFYAQTPFVYEAVIFSLSLIIAVYRNQLLRGLLYIRNLYNIRKHWK